MPSDAPPRGATAQPLFDLQIDINDIPRTGLAAHWRASDKDRARAARFLDILEIRDLMADYKATRRADGSVVVKGRMMARVEQSCVVTGEPVISNVEEPIDAVFSPHVERLRLDLPAGETQETLSLEEDPPEPLEDGRADLGRLIAELLSLGIDPYPRKAGAVFEAFVTDEPGTGEAGPFAALEKLIKPPS
jgi:hypothetical protein